MKKKEIEKCFKNKTVLITGHTGFKGSWLALWLHMLGAKIIGVSKDIPTKPSLFNVLKLKHKITHIILNLENLNKFKNVIKKHNPDFVFHLAAQSLVKKSYANPTITFKSNIIGTMNVLEALRTQKKKCISVIITSDKSYKNLELNRGYREDDILGGRDPYSASKAGAELVIQSYINSFFNYGIKNNKMIAIARAGNVIGGGDWSKDRLIPDCIKSWSRKQIVTIRNPKSTRPWQHVFEALRGYLELATKLSKNTKLHGEAFNFGPKKSQNKKVIELIQEIKISWNDIKWKIIKAKTNKLESQLLRLDSQKAKQLLNWEPKLKFSDSIKMVINWYKKYYFKKKNLFDYSQNQIVDYINKIEKN